MFKIVDRKKDRGRAGTIRLSSDTIHIAIHAMRYDTYHDISTLIKQHLEALFL